MSLKNYWQEEILSRGKKIELLSRKILARIKKTVQYHLKELLYSKPDEQIQNKENPEHSTDMKLNKGYITGSQITNEHNKTADKEEEVLKKASGSQKVVGGY